MPYIPSSNPFERAADAWSAEVYAEAARLLELGAARNPDEALRKAEGNVQANRALRTTATLTKVAPDPGGPLGAAATAAATAFIHDRAGEGPL